MRSSAAMQSESDLLDGILAACLERVPRPEPNWEAGADTGGPVSPAGERPFALVPRRRFVGVRFGQHRSPRRGPGRRGRGHAAVPAGRPADVDRLAGVGAPLGRPRHRRVRRPRVLRRHGSAGRARGRPAAADGALRAAAALARQAGDDGGGDRVDRPGSGCRRGRARLRRAAGGPTPMALARPAADRSRARRSPR